VSTRVNGRDQGIFASWVARLNFPRKQSESPQNREWRSLPTRGKSLLYAAIALSVLIHIGSWLPLDWLARRSSDVDMKLSNKERITVRINPIATKAEKEPEKLESIVETRLEETEKPTESARLGQQDHKADRETKLAMRPNQERAADAGPKGTRPTAPPKLSDLAQNEKRTSENKPEIKSEKIAGEGTLMMGPPPRKKTDYEKILPTGSADLSGQVNAGWQEHLEDDIPVGNRIDVNTTNYRYISYFTGMRKAVELVWVYPSDAIRRGIQGQGVLHFTINKDGKVTKVRIARSTGFAVLDRAFVEAIRLASPFAPLPQSMGKDRLDVTFAFGYYLNSYAGGH
jgi:protein TonB